MSVRNITGTLAAAVATSGTFTVSYPSDDFAGVGVLDEGDFFNAMRHQLIVGGNVYNFPKDFNVTLGTGNITITNQGATTWPAGATFTLGLNRPGKAVYADIGNNQATGERIYGTTRCDTFLINLGAPDVADADGVCASQSLNAGVNALINGALASGGEVVFDTPRNVVAAWTGTAVLTVHGFDVYGKAMTQSSASGTSLTGTKAFKRVTRVTTSANITGLTVGSGDVLGLPVFLPSAGHVIRELQDGATATAGTLVAGIRTAGGSTATTGDVRGTYDPNAACDGDRVFQLIVSLPDPGYRGIDQA